MRSELWRNSGGRALLSSDEGVCDTSEEFRNYGMSVARRNKRAGRNTSALGTRGVGQAALSVAGGPATTAESLLSAIFSGRALWISLGLVAVSIFIYAPVWHHTFVNYDDPLYVSDNPFVSRGLSWQSLKWAFTTGHDSNWFPITWVSLMLDGQFHGLNAGGYLLTNLFLHVIDGLLLFGLLY